MYTAVNLFDFLYLVVVIVLYAFFSIFYLYIRTCTSFVTLFRAVAASASATNSRNLVRIWAEFPKLFVFPSGWLLNEYLGEINYEDLDVLVALCPVSVTANPCSRSGVYKKYHAMREGKVTSTVLVGRARRSILPTGISEWERCHRQALLEKPLGTEGV
ncbi:hypothetical protein E2C01_070761 [Portunus trituberculatus]|uniref:Uncharacterized protein n=1 Tax=Portunus trituberculatus TaxID=210409 RepID=A0A5B7HTK7_PORTR|nr:hypothetical protein [Portunus trituberculatus]